ncbi:MAG: TonB-dependent receptor, partial [Kordiimonas sp.]
MSYREKKRIQGPNSKYAVAPIALATLLGSTSNLVYAQQDTSADASTLLEEIIITARKRSENLQETPIAISAFTNQELESRSLTNLAELGSFVPNVTMATGAGGSGGGSNLQVYIRGIGQADFLFTTDPGVGVYVDGVYYPRSLGGVLDLLDLERVEVLRGPQGTLFGKNTIGGAINVVSRKPVGDGTGYIEGTIGRYNRLDLRGSFDVALSETFFAKVSVSSKDRDGYGRRLDFFSGEETDRSGNENQTAARLALHWKASDTVTVDLSADYTREREQSVPEVLAFYDESVSAIAQLWNVLVADPVPMSTVFLTSEDDPFTTFATGPNESNLDAGGASMTINWEISDNIAFKSITAYRKMDGRFGRDGDGSPANYIATDNTQDQKQFSQEIQFGGTAMDDKLVWLVGGFYFDEYGRDENDVILASGLFNALEALPGTLDGSPLSAPTAPGGPGNPINISLDLDFDIFNEIDIKSYAAFTQSTYNITDRLGLTAGLRYSYETKDYTLDHQKVASGAPIINLTTVSDSWDSFTPLVALDYQMSDNALLYASYSRGFKSGGFNGRPINEGAVSSYDPEEVTAYEIGIKSDLLDNRLRLNIAAFYSDYTDIQLSAVSADENGVLQLVVDNAGDAEVKGFEVELTAKPTANLDVSSAIGYTDFKLTELAPGATDITLESSWPKTPSWTASSSIQYTIPIDNFGSFAIR